MKTDKWQIELPAVVPSRDPVLVVRNGEDITEVVQSITIRASRNELTTVTVEFIKADVNVQTEGDE